MDKDNYQRISKKEVSKLLKEFVGELDSAFEKKHFIELYNLNDKRAVMDFGSHGFLFNSLLDAELYLERIDSTVTTGKIHHILEGKFQYDYSFPLKTKQLQKDLFDLLKLEETVYTDIEFQKIDKLISERLNSVVFADKIFPNMVAYVGEYMISKLSNARWEMIKSEQAEIWEPYVIDGKLNRYNPFYIVYKELYEYFPAEGEVFLLEHTKIELVQYQVKIK